MAYRPRLDLNRSRAFGNKGHPWGVQPKPQTTIQIIIIMHAKNILRPIALFAALTLMTLSASSAPFQIGQKFPSILLPSLEDGQPLSVQQFHGEKVLLPIFASW
jgi:hypothetical protein